MKTKTSEIPAANAFLTGRSRPENPPATGHESAFTLTELIVVFATVAILATMLLPALAASKPNSKVAQCLNDKRQLTLAWLMYADENSDKLMGYGWISQNSYMDWTSSSRNTNTAALLDPTQSLIAGYVQSASLFKCPADNYQSAANPGPRARSVSMNTALNGSAVSPGSIPGRTYFEAEKASELLHPGPASTFVFLDEQADSINDGLYSFDPGLVPGTEYWRDPPASYHNRCGSLSFADGHSEIHQWQDSRTVLPVKYVAWSTQYPSHYRVQQSGDYEWMDDRMPYH